MRDLLPTIEEYLGRTDPQIKKNAITALAAIGTRESIETLVRIAMDESTPEPVRNRAEVEIAGLPMESRQFATAQVQLRMEDKKSAIPAYLLAGRLRSRGFPIGRPELSWPRRVLLAASLGRHLSATASLHSRVRGALPGLLGGASGAALLGLVLLSAGAMHRSTGDIIPDLSAILFFLSFSGMLLSVAAAVIVTQFTTPVYLQFDRRAALVLEPFAAMLGSLILVAISFLAWLFLRFAVDNQTPGLEMLILLELVLVAGLVRIGTLVAYGVFRRPRLNMLLQAVTGVVAGVSLLSLLPLFLTSEEIAHTAKDIWFFSVPVCFGLATAFARIDSQVEARGRTVGNAAFPIAVAAVGVFAGVLAIAASIGIVRQAERRPVPVITYAGSVDSERSGAAPPRPEPVDRLIPLQLIPQRVQLNVGTQSEVWIMATENVPQTERDLKVEIYDRRTQSQQLAGDDPPLIVGQLEKGEYTLLVSRFEAPDSREGSNHYGAQQYDRLKLTLTTYLGLTDAPNLPGTPENPLKNVSLRIAIGLDSAGAQRFSHWSDSVTAVLDWKASSELLKGAPDYFNAITVCQNGTLLGLHRHPETQAACDLALDFDSESVDTRDIRGINRALNRNFKGAIEDFTIVSNSLFIDEAQRVERLRWIQALNVGQNPITPGVLGALRERFIFGGGLF